MALFERLLSSDLAHHLGWVLLHSLWLMLVPAAALAFALLIVPERMSRTRYVMSGAALLALAGSLGIASLLVPARIVATSDAELDLVVEEAALIDPFAEVQTLPPLGEAGVEYHPPFAWLSPDGEENAAVGEPRSTPGGGLDPAEPGITNEVASVGAEDAGPKGWYARTVAAAQPFVGWAVPVWLVGVLALALWHLGGLIAAHRLRSIGTRPAPAHAARLMDALMQQMRIKQAVTLLESAVVQSPVVVGWLKPVVLMPASVLTGMPAEQLEAILAHELAHIRRHDYFVNLVQTLVVTLLFYHPAVWWVSRVIRNERECCCDDIVIKLTNRKLDYAKALTHVALLRNKPTHLAVAANSGSLLERIKRMMGMDDAATSAGPGPKTWLAGVLVLLLAVALPITLMASQDRTASELEADNANSDSLDITDQGQEDEPELENTVSIEEEGSADSFDAPEIILGLNHQVPPGVADDPHREDMVGPYWRWTGTAMDPAVISDGVAHLGGFMWDRDGEPEQLFIFIGHPEFRSGMMSEIALLDARTGEPLPGLGETVTSFRTSRFAAGNPGDQQCWQLYELPVTDPEALPDSAVLRLRFTRPQEPWEDVGRAVTPRMDSAGVRIADGVVLAGAETAAQEDGGERYTNVTIAIDHALLQNHQYRVVAEYEDGSEVRSQERMYPVYRGQEGPTILRRKYVVGGREIHNIRLQRRPVSVATYSPVALKPGLSLTGHHVDVFHPSVDVGTEPQPVEPADPAAAILGVWYGQFVDSSYLPSDRWCVWEFRDDGKCVYTLGVYGPDGRIDLPVDPAQGRSMVTDYEVDEQGRLVLVIPGEDTKYCPFEIRNDIAYISVDHPNDFVFSREKNPEQFQREREQARVKQGARRFESSFHVLLGRWTSSRGNAKPQTLAGLLGGDPYPAFTPLRPPVALPEDYHEWDEGTRDAWLAEHAGLAYLSAPEGEPLPPGHILLFERPTPGRDELLVTRLIDSRRIGFGPESMARAQLDTLLQEQTGQGLDAWGFEDDGDDGEAQPGAGAEAAGDEYTHLTIPNAETGRNGWPYILDLDNARLGNITPDMLPEGAGADAALAELAGGDLAFDELLIAMPGVEVGLASQDWSLHLWRVDVADDWGVSHLLAMGATAHRFASPDREYPLRVTSDEGAVFEVIVLGQTEDGGLEVKYRQIARAGDRGAERQNDSLEAQLVGTWNLTAHDGEAAEPGTVHILFRSDGTGEIVAGLDNDSRFSMIWEIDHDRGICAITRRRDAVDREQTLRCVVELEGDQLVLNVLPDGPDSRAETLTFERQTPNAAQPQGLRVGSALIGRWVWCDDRIDNIAGIAEFDAEGGLVFFDPDGGAKAFTVESAHVDGREALRLTDADGEPAGMLMIEFVGEDRIVFRGDEGRELLFREAAYERIRQETLRLRGEGAGDDEDGNDVDDLLGVWYIQKLGGEWVPTEETDSFDFGDDGVIRTQGRETAELSYRFDGDRQRIVLLDRRDEPDAFLGYTIDQGVLVLTHEQADGQTQLDPRLIESLQIVLTRSQTGNAEHRRMRALPPDPRSTRAKMLSAQQMRSMYQGLAAIARTNRDTYLGSVGVLLTIDMVTPEYLLSPWSKAEVPGDFRDWSDERKAEWAEANCSYAFVLAGEKVTLDNEKVILFELPLVAGMDRIGVCYEDGHTNSLTYAEADGLIEEQTGKNLMGWMDHLGREQRAAEGPVDEEAAAPGDDARGEAAEGNDYELLLRVAEAHRANTRQIETWAGGADVTSVSVDPEGDGYHMTSTVEFLTDSAQGKRWRWEVTAAERTEGGVRAQDPRQISVLDQMIRGEVFYNLANGVRQTGSTEWQRTMVILPAERAWQHIGMYSRSLDPHWYLTDDGSPIPDWLNMFYEHREEIGDRLSVTREGSVVTVENVLNGSVNRHRFDLDQGGNLIERYASHGESTWNTEITYVEIEGVWVPAHYKRTSQTPTNGLHEREVIFKDQVLNVPVPEDEFTMEAMGILPDTRVSDHIEGIFYEYPNKADARRINGAPPAPEARGDDVITLHELAAYWDGGTLGFSYTDAEGVQIEGAIDGRRFSETRYRLYLRAMHPTHDGAELVGEDSEQERAVFDALRGWVDASFTAEQFAALRANVDLGDLPEQEAWAVQIVQKLEAVARSRQHQRAAGKLAIYPASFERPNPPQIGRDAEGVDVPDGDAGESRTVYRLGEALLTVDGVAEVRVGTVDGLGRPTIQLTFTPVAAERLEEYTRDHLNEPLLICIDGEPVVAPMIRQALSDTVTISGSTITEDMARAIEQAVEDPDVAEDAVPNQQGAADDPDPWAAEMDRLSRLLPQNSGRDPLVRGYEALIESHSDDPRIGDAMLAIANLYGSIKIPELGIEPDRDMARHWVERAAAESTEGSHVWIEARFALAGWLPMEDTESSRGWLEDVRGQAQGDSLMLLRVEHGLMSTYINEHNWEAAVGHAEIALGWYGDPAHIPADPFKKSEVDARIAATARSIAAQLVSADITQFRREALMQRLWDANPILFGKYDLDDPHRPALNWRASNQLGVDQPDVHNEAVVAQAAHCQHMAQRLKESAHALANDAAPDDPRRTPEGLVRLSYHELNPAMVRAMLDQDDLPKLHAMLADPAHAKQWPEIAQVVCFLSDDPAASLPVVLDYIRRSSLGRRAESDHFGYHGRAQAIEWLGFLGGEEAERTLLEILTEDGAAELTAAWDDGPKPGWFESEYEGKINVVMGRAAIGMVYMQSEEGILAVEERFAQACIDRQTMNGTPGLFVDYIHALAQRDVIRVVGIETYRTVIFEMGMGDAAAAALMQPYRDRMHGR